MPFKHEVTDKNGKVHKRVSADRQYAFAVVRHSREFQRTVDGVDNVTFPASSAASWSGRLDLAQKEAAAMRSRGYYTDVEILPCTPVATGKHKVSA